MGKINKKIYLIILLIISILITICSIVFYAYSRYVLKYEHQISIGYKSGIISESDIKINPTTWTNKTVSVTVTNTDGSSIEYKIGENGDWKSYSTAFEVEENTTICFRKVYGTQLMPETKKAITNIDKESPVIAQNGDPSKTEVTKDDTFTIPLKITDTASGINSADFSIDDIEVKVGDAISTTVTKKLKYDSVKNGVYSYTLTLSGITESGDLTLTIPENSVNDIAENANTETILETGVNVKNECTIIFEYNGADEEFEKNLTVQSGQVIKLPSPTKIGYSLDGWYSDEKYTKKAGDGNEDYIVNKDEILYAHWTANTYDIIYNMGDATGGSLPGKQTATYNSNISLRYNNLTKAQSNGYTITYENGTATSGTVLAKQTQKISYTANGWATSINGEKVYENSQSFTPYTLTNGLTLYPSWTSSASVMRTGTNNMAKSRANLGTITFNYNRSGYANETGIAYATYAPNGWSTTSDGTIQAYTNAQTVTLTEDITLYPCFAETLHSPTFPTKSITGYILEGWYTEAEGGTKVETYTEPEDITLYAHWELQEYDIIYNNGDATGGTLPENQVVTRGGTVTLGTNNMTKDKTENGYTITYEIGDATSGTVPEKQTQTISYTPNGWATTVNGTSRYSSGQVLSNYTYTTGLTLYPSWKNVRDAVVIGTNTTEKASTNLGTVTFNYNGSGQENTTSTAYIMYTANGWTTTSGSQSRTYTSGQSAVPSGNITLYPCFTQTKQSAEFPTPIRPGYTFEGWYTTAIGGTKVTSYTGTNAVTYYAHWKENTYQINLDRQNATSTSVVSIYEKYNVGIYKEASCQNEVTSESGISVPERKYDVYYYGNGGTVTIANATAIYNFEGYYTEINGAGTKMLDENGCLTENFTNTTYTSNATLYAYWTGGTLTINTPTRAGYIFTGWYDSASDDANLIIEPGKLYAPTSTLKLYAHWEAITYTVEYYYGDTKIGSSNHEYGVEKTLTKAEDLGVASKGDFSFYGWSTENSDSTKKYNDGENVKNITTVQDDVIKLYVIWTRNVTFYSGLNKVSATTVAQYVNGGTFKLKTPNESAVNGYTAIGWRIDNNATSEMYKQNTEIIVYATEVGSDSFKEYYGVYSRDVSFKSGIKYATSVSVKQYYNTTGNYSVKTPTPAEISGWNIEGWRSNSLAIEKEYDSESLITGTSATYYAVYSRLITLKYDANGGSGTVENQTATQIYNSFGNISTPSFIVQKNNFTNDTYAFMYWSSGPTSGSIYAVGATYKSFTPAVDATNVTTTLYARWGEAVARIDSKYYYKLEYAITDAGDTSSTIELLKNVNENVTIDKGQKITLDLNEKVLSSASASNSKPTITNNGTLTVEKGTLRGNASNAILNNGLCNIGIGTVNGTSANPTILNSSTGTVKVTGNVSTLSTTANVIQNDGGMVYINGGTVSGIFRGICNNSGITEIGLGSTVSVTGTSGLGLNYALEGVAGTINIKGGSVIADQGKSSNRALAVYVHETVDLNISGDAVIKGTHTGIQASGTGAIKIKGGTISAESSISGNDYSGKAIYTSRSITMTGGTIIAPSDGIGIFQYSTGSFTMASTDADIHGSGEGSVAISQIGTGDITIELGQISAYAGAINKTSTGTITIGKNEFEIYGQESINISAYSKPTITAESATVKFYNGIIASASENAKPFSDGTLANIEYNSTGIDLDAGDTYYRYNLNSVLVNLNAVKNSEGGSYSSTTKTWKNLGSGSDGIINGATWTAGRALKFDGVDDWVNLGICNAVEKMTMEVLFSLDSIDNNTYILGNWEAGGGGIYINPSDKKIRGQLYINGSYVTVVSDVVAEVGTPYRVSLIYDGSSLKLYVNGVVKSVSASGKIGVPANNTVMAIGTNPTGSSPDKLFFKGEVYKVRIFNKALTESQILE